MFKAAFFILSAVICFANTLPAYDDVLAIPLGKAIKVDGIISPGEWDDAGSVNIRVEADWNVTVLYKHDAAHLFVAFRNTHRGKVRRYPEVMIDAQNLKSDSWQSGQWWLHASYNLCEAEGAYSASSCSPTKERWDANNPPSGNDVEFQIDLAKIGINANAPFGVAFDVTDATGTLTQKWSLWPSFSNIRRPKTWGQAILAVPKIEKSSR